MRKNLSGEQDKDGDKTKAITQVPYHWHISFQYILLFSQVLYFILGELALSKHAQGSALGQFIWKSERVTIWNLFGCGLPKQPLVQMKCDHLASYPWSLQSVAELEHLLTKQKVLLQLCKPYSILSLGDEAEYGWIIRK